MSLVKNMHRRYDDFVIDIPEWQIADRGITVLKGPSGSGKSTVIRLLIGLDDCPQLSWAWGDELDLAKMPIEKRRLGVVFQNYELFPHMTAQENIYFAAKARKIAPDVYKQNYLNIVKQLQIENFLNKNVQVLSGGEKQRVALARALIGQPRFLFLDEPFTALDAELRSEARLLVKKTISEFNIPTLLVTHDQSDVDTLADCIVSIDKGKLIR